MTYLERIDTDQYTAFVMPYISGGDLLEYVTSNGSICETEAKQIFKQIIECMINLHDLGIRHNDIKLDNFLIDSDNQQIYLIDWGCSTICDPDDEMYNFCGTDDYMAPEMLSMLPSTEKADIYSCGIVLCGILTNSLSPDLVLQNKNHFEGISGDCRDLLNALLEEDPNDRINLMKILHHPWFSSNEQQTTKCKASKRKSCNCDDMITSINIEAAIENSLVRG